MNTRQRIQLDARLNYLEERLGRIKASLDVYSQPADTYVAATWTYEDDSKISKNLNSCISAARNCLVSASAKSNERPRAMTIVPIIHSTDLVVNPNTGDLLTDQDSPLDSWVRLPSHAASSSQPLSEARSPIDMLSPTATTHGFLQGDEETEDEFTWAHDALRNGATSVPNDPFLDSTSSHTRASVDTYSTAPTEAEKRPEDDPQASRKLSSYAEEVISSHFSAIRELCASNDREKAASAAVEFMMTYTPNASTIPHESEIRNNVINGGNLGLAGTGHGYAPLHFFISLPTECAFEVSLLIDHDVDVNATLLAHAIDSHSRTPCHTALQLAAERGHPNIISLLASSPSIDLEAADSRGLTPLFIAWRKGHLACVEALLTHGALFAGVPDVWQGNSLLHGCAWLCQPDLVRLLLALGADVNARNVAGSTPLIAAAISTDIADARLRRRKAVHCVSVMKMLLDAGAKFRMRNHAGHTAMYYAEWERNVRVVALLEGRGAKRAIVEAHPLHPHDVVMSLVKRVMSSPTKPQMSDIRRARTMST
jgi:ankyrin repeat protein